MQQKLFCGLAVEAMAVFRDLRNFVVQREPQTQVLRCYCANADANAQSEWVLSDILCIAMEEGMDTYRQVTA